MSSRFTEKAFKKSFRDKWSAEHKGSWKKDRAKRWIWEEAEVKEVAKVAPTKTKTFKEVAPKSPKKRVFKTKIGE